MTGVTGTIWMTRITCMIRMNRMTINEMTWMAGMTKTTGMTRIHTITWFTVITRVTGMIVMKRKSKITGATRMNGVMRQLT